MDNTILKFLIILIFFPLHLPGAIVEIAAVTFCVGWGVDRVVVMGTGVVGTVVLGVTVLALLVEPVLLPVNKPGNCKTKT